VRRDRRIILSKKAAKGRIRIYNGIGRIEL